MGFSAKLKARQRIELNESVWDGERDSNGPDAIEGIKIVYY